MFWWSTCYTKIKYIYQNLKEKKKYIYIYIYRERERERERQREREREWEREAFMCGKIEIMHGIREGMIIL